MKRLLKFCVLFTMVCQWNTIVAANDGVGLPETIREDGRKIILTIGINNYGDLQLKNCVSDSRKMIAKVKEEYDSVIVFSLFDEQATKSNILAALKEAAAVSEPGDDFLFFIASQTIEMTDFQTYLVPYIDPSEGEFKRMELSTFPTNRLLGVNEIAMIMNQIQCMHQLVISESGMGADFASNLISELFEMDPLLAFGSDRERIIITTKGFGYDNHFCDGKSTGIGPLCFYLLNLGQFFRVFEDFDGYEYALRTEEKQCPLANRDHYVALYRESDYRKILLINFRKQLHIQDAMRGTGVQDLDVPEQGTESKLYALLIATNQYDKSSGWNSLLNPIRDADAIGGLLEKKYGATTIKAYNKTREEVLKEIIALRQVLDSNDKLIFFVAGHGHYNPEFGDGSLVFMNSKSLEEDVLMDSYLHMATLNRLLNTLPSKSIFAIFDVCFGASFDLLSKDLDMTTYAKGLDVDIVEFDKRKSTYTTRIFLSSGRYSVPDYWNNSLNHSPFATRLIDALEQEREFTSPGRLYASLQGNATEPFLKKFGSHDNRGDMILAVRG